MIVFWKLRREASPLCTAGRHVQPLSLTIGYYGGRQTPSVHVSAILRRQQGFCYFIQRFHIRIF